MMDLSEKIIENAILKGRIEKKLTHDSRGTRYRIEGPALDERPIHVVCRFRESDNLLIITVSVYYAVDAFLSKRHAVEERLSVEVVRFNQMAA